MIRRGFTLIELLVVIAIIAILAAILFPVFAQAKASAKQTTALSNVKQITTSMFMYNGDSDDVSVPYVWYNRGDGEYISWMEMLNPYVKNTGIFLNQGMSTSQGTFGVNCTGAPGANVNSHYIISPWNRWDYYNWNGTVMFAGWATEANVNNNYAGGACDPAALASRPWASCTGMTRVEQPADVAILFPGYFVSYPRPTKGTAFGYPCTTGFNLDHGVPTPAPDNIFPFRKGNVYGMADGHAKFYVSANFNGNASKPHAYGGANYPSSPFMVVQN